MASAFWNDQSAPILISALHGASWKISLAAIMNTLSTSTSSAHSYTLSAGHSKRTESCRDRRKLKSAYSGLQNSRYSRPDASLKRSTPLAWIGTLTRRLFNFLCSLPVASSLRGTYSSLPSADLAIQTTVGRRMKKQASMDCLIHIDNNMVMLMVLIQFF